MKAKLITLLCLILVLVAGSRKADAENKNLVQWQKWSDKVFQQSAEEKKLVYLNLEAVWCHWCHVMEEKTYSNAKVAELLNQKFIPVRVDQDSHPDLAMRYQEFGWPATIVLNAKAEEIKTLTGYVESAKLIKILEESLQNPLPKQGKSNVETDFNKDSALPEKYKEELLKKHYDSLDMSIGGLRTRHKFLDSETLEYAFTNAVRGNDKDIAFLKLSLDSNLKLIDPVWGGVYQYSTHRDWQHPHFEKIIRLQADNLKLYSFAYSKWGTEKYWQAATDIYRYVKDFLTSESGAFYVSQDADVIKGQHAEGYFALNDAQRRKQGIPAIDENIYARENGWMISGLTAIYSATGNRTMLEDALRAANWIVKNRRITDAGFRHGENDIGGPFLGDSLYMGRAMLDLYAATGDRNWLRESTKEADFIEANFNDKNTPGYSSAVADAKSPLKPHKSLSENIAAVRFLNLLSHYTGDKKYKERASAAMRYLATPASSSGYINDSGILLADYELNNEPLHITIVGHKDDALAAELFAAGLKYFSPYKRTEWWDKREGPMPNPDVEYPQMQKSAAFICTNKRCSLPIFKPQGIASTIALFLKD